MNYINPFELLNIQSENLSDIDSSIIRRAKKNLLADIELSDNNTINHNGIELTKSDCIRAVDDLDNKDKNEFHYFIFKNPDLNSFLTNGDLHFFKTYKSESIYKLPEFLDFISPFFAFQYDKQLSINYKKRNIDNVKLLLSTKLLANEDSKELCFKGTYTRLKEIENEINSLNKNIIDKKSTFIENKFNGLATLIAEKVDVELLNTLPIYFQSLRNSLALTVRNLARDINNEPYFLYEPAFKIIEIANNISTDGLSKQTITKGYYTIKKNYDDDCKKEENVKLSSQYSETFAYYKGISDIINKTIRELDEEIIKSVSNNFADDFLKQLETAKFNIAEINSLPGIFDDTRKKIAIQIKSLSVTIWNDYEKIEPSFKLIQLASTIKVDEETKEKIKKDYDTLKAIDEKKRLQGSPIVSTPSLSTINGIGTKIYEDTLYFVLLYIPIFPIARYYLKYDGDKSYRFLGKLELHKWQKLWQKIIVGGTILLILFAIVDSNNSSKNNITPKDSTPTKDDYSNKKIKPLAPLEFKYIYDYPYIENGNITGCSNIKPKYNKKIDNELTISCGSNADVAVKMINYETEKSIRYVYIHKNSTYTIRNIPEGKYFLKIAYGSDWGVKPGESICQGQFTANTLYKKGDEILDYNLIYSEDGRYQIPSFSLKLDVVFTKDKMNTFETNSINENEFYNE